MTLRPVDETGDILPVGSVSDLLSGPEAVARLVEDRLELLRGDWWENPAWGNEILDLMKESRLTESDFQALDTCLSGYIRETPGVTDVRDVSFSADGRQMRYSCVAVTEDGQAEVTYTI